MKPNEYDYICTCANPHSVSISSELNGKPPPNSYHAANEPRIHKVVPKLVDEFAIEVLRSRP